MNNLLILVDEIGEKKRLFAEYIAKNFPSGSNVVITIFSDIVYDINGTDIDIQIDGIDKNIKDFDLIYFRRAGNKYAIPAGNLALCLKHLGIKFFDTTFKDIGPLGNKLTSYLKLSIAGVPTIPSFFCHPEKVLKYKNQIIEKFGFPFVAKELSAQRGEGVYLIKSSEDFDRLPPIGPHGKNTEYLFQGYYENDEEYRILVLKDRVGAYERKIRTDPNEFRSNVILGSREEFIDIKKIPLHIKNIAIKAAKALDIQIAGVDILIDKKGEVWVLEANRGPGITYDSKVSPELPNLAKFFANELNTK